MRELSISPKQIEQEWDRAVAQAQAETPRAQHLDNDVMNQAVGLRLEAGIKAGGWTSTYTDAFSCGCG